MNSSTNHYFSKENVSNELAISDMVYMTGHAMAIPT